MFTTVTEIVNTLGECPIWCHRSRRLFWSDIPACKLFALDPASGSVQHWPLPEPLGSFALTVSVEILLMGLASRLGYFNLVTGLFSEIADTPGATGTRINDGRCDRLGNFVFGTMDAREPIRVAGRFHRLNASTLKTETLNLPVAAIPNSICFSPDGGTMYYADSLQGRIFCCDYPSLNNQRVFIHVSGPGAPDGSCIDAQGFIWNAEWGGGRVVRYRPEGGVDQIINTGCIQTTCPVLAGTGYDELYCTSARAGLNRPNDGDGKLIKAQATVSRGLPESLFAGALPDAFLLAGSAG